LSVWAVVGLVIWLGPAVVLVVWFCADVLANKVRVWRAVRELTRPSSRGRGRGGKLRGMWTALW